MRHAVSTPPYCVHTAHGPPLVTAPNSLVEFLRVQCPPQRDPPRQPAPRRLRPVGARVGGRPQGDPLGVAAGEEAPVDPRALAAAGRARRRRVGEGREGGRGGQVVTFDGGCDLSSLIAHHSSSAGFTHPPCLPHPASPLPSPGLQRAHLAARVVLRDAKGAVGVQHVGDRGVGCGRQRGDGRGQPAV